MLLVINAHVTRANSTIRKADIHQEDMIIIHAYAANSGASNAWSNTNRTERGTQRSRILKVSAWLKHPTKHSSVSITHDVIF